ncbi:HNH endonuclease [Bifidobacterium samirii]|uniref:Restriction endonuclease n=1 Tax=Bifidobacterium samirii TaxID=2306974 RepID=A0A430FJD8_9BIFI|nr:HNH endonuclease signature motif containing protein [Bifidobacterium samirii]RSX53005.1 restriction endonuclease [Bifidobacterium samirii]
MSGRRTPDGPSPDTRRTVLARDGWKCAICGRNIDHRWSGFSIHHRLKRSQGHGYDGLHEPGNLLPLCGSGSDGCHGWVHGKAGDTAYRLGYLVPSWQDPTHTPVYYRRHGWQLLAHDGTRRPTVPPDGMDAWIGDITHDHERKQS